MQTHTRNAMCVCVHARALPPPTHSQKVSTEANLSLAVSTFDAFQPRTLTPPSKGWDRGREGGDRRAEVLPQGSGRATVLRLQPPQEASRRTGRWWNPRWDDRIQSRLRPTKSSGGRKGLLEVGQSFKMRFPAHRLTVNKVWVIAALP